MPEKTNCLKWNLNVLPQLFQEISIFRYEHGWKISSYGKSDISLCGLMPEMNDKGWICYRSPSKKKLNKKTPKKTGDSKEQSGKTKCKHCIPKQYLLPQETGDQCKLYL